MNEGRKVAIDRSDIELADLSDAKEHSQINPENVVRQSVLTFLRKTNNKGESGTLSRRVSPLADVVESDDAANKASSSESTKLYEVLVHDLGLKEEQRFPTQHSWSDVDISHQKRRCTDVMFFVLFWLQVAGLVGIFLFRYNANVDNQIVLDRWMHVKGRIYTYSAAVALALILACVWLLVMRFGAKYLIKGTIFSAIVTCAVFGAVALAIVEGTGARIGWAAFWFSICLLCVLYFALVRRRIPFATLVMRTALHVLSQFPSIFVVAFLSNFLQIIWVAMWIYTYFSIQNMWEQWAVDNQAELTDTQNGSLATPNVNATNVTAQLSSSEEVLANFLSFYLFLSLFWTSMVIRNTLFVTSSGVVAHWYMGKAKDRRPVAVVGQVFGIAVSKNFGSIIFGSLLVSFIRLIRVLVEGLRRYNPLQNGWLWMVADFCFGCVEALVKYFNGFAYAYIAIYGRSFIASAKAAWELFRRSGLDRVVNDDVISGALFLTYLLVSCLCGGMGAFWVYRQDSAESDWFYGAALPCAIIGFIMGVVTLDTVAGAVTTLFVCFGEDPSRLYEEFPDLGTALYEALVAQWVGDVNNANSDDDGESSAYDSDSEDDYEYLIMKEREERQKAKEATNKPVTKETTATGGELTTNKPSMRRDKDEFPASAQESPNLRNTPLTRHEHNFSV